MNSPTWIPSSSLFPEIETFGVRLLVSTSVKAPIELAQSSCARHRSLAAATCSGLSFAIFLGCMYLAEFIGLFARHVNASHT